LIFQYSVSRFSKAKLYRMYTHKYKTWNFEENVEQSKKINKQG